MLIGKAIAIVMVLGTMNARCQSKTEQNTGPTCSFAEVYRQEGWTIPGLDGAKKQLRQAWKDKPGFFITSLQPSQPESFIFPNASCPYDHPGRLVIENRPIRVMNLISWDYQGKVFGYEVVYALQVIENGARTELAAATAVQFFDIDGSGRFSVMRPPDYRNLFAPTVVPDWLGTKIDRPAAN